MSRNLLAILGVSLIASTATPALALPPAHLHYAHALSAHSGIKPESRDPIGDEETNALNVLEANGYTGMTNLHMRGDQVFVDAMKNNELEHLVVTQEDTITKAT
ncbi:MAG TPA: hypothetical protein VEH07_05775 [Alphaproteobacteria bacterium]|nr:hypothetical protein [Alphaproteobacteria bacterium]